MHEGKIYTCDITEDEIQPILIKQILQENVDEEFYITEDKKPKWVYLKGAKKFQERRKMVTSICFLKVLLHFQTLGIDREEQC